MVVFLGRCRAHCQLLYVICYLFIICQLLSINYYLLTVNCYLLTVNCYLFTIIFRLFDYRNQKAKKFVIICLKRTKLVIGEVLS